jgi:hypothetical protein
MYLPYVPLITYLPAILGLVGFVGGPPAGGPGGPGAGRCRGTTVSVGTDRTPGRTRDERPWPKI